MRWCQISDLTSRLLLLRVADMAENQPKVLFSPTVVGGSDRMFTVCMCEERLLSTAQRTHISTSQLLLLFRHALSLILYDAIEVNIPSL